MDWTSLLAVFPKEAIPPLLGALVGSLVGGFLTLTASITAQYLTHRFTRRRERAQLMRDKAEELLHLLSQHRDWVNTKTIARLNQADHNAPSPWDQALVIQYLYFPQLAPYFIASGDALRSFFTILSKLPRHPPELLVEQQALLTLLKEANEDLKTWDPTYTAAIMVAMEAIQAVTRPFRGPFLRLPGAFAHGSRKPRKRY